MQALRHVFNIFQPFFLYFDFHPLERSNCRGMAVFKKFFLRVFYRLKSEKKDENRQIYNVMLFFFIN